jgi:hypothetical protein
MPSHLTVPSGAGSNLTASSSFTLVNGGSSDMGGSFSFADLEGQDPAQQVGGHSDMQPSDYKTMTE